MASEQASHTYKEKIHYMKLHDKEVLFLSGTMNVSILTGKGGGNLEIQN